MGAEHFLMNEQSIIANVADMIGSSWTGGPIVAGRAGEAIHTLNRFFLGKINDTMLPGDAQKFGQIVKNVMEKNIGVTRAVKTAKWFKASQSITGKNYPIKMDSVTNYFAKNKKLPHLKKPMDELETIVMKTLEKFTGVERPQNYLGNINFNLDAEFADALWHTLNGIKSPELGPFAKKFARSFRDDLFTGLEQTAKKSGDDKAFRAFTDAKEYHEYFMDNHASKLVDSMIERASRDASAIQSAILLGSNKYGNLMKMKEVLAQPKWNPKSKLYTGGQYEKHVLPSLRWKILNKAIRPSEAIPELGKYFDGKTAIELLTKNGLEVSADFKVLPNKFLEEVYGGHKGLQEIYNFARAAQSAERGASGNKIIVKIMEAAALVGGARAATVGDIKQVGGAAAILFTPFAMAQAVFGNAKALRQLTDGLLGYSSTSDLAATAIRIGFQAKYGERFHAEVDNFFDEGEEYRADPPQGVPASKAGGMQSAQR
jgi:tRNA U38,U39,U40 pseudouridine synthase TruA